MTPFLQSFLCFLYAREDSQNNVTLCHQAPFPQQEAVTQLCVSVSPVKSCVTPVKNHFCSKEAF